MLWPGSSGSHRTNASPGAGTGRGPLPGSGSWRRGAIRSSTPGGSLRSWWPTMCGFAGCGISSERADWGSRSSAPAASTRSTRPRLTSSSSRVGSESRQPWWPRRRRAGRRGLSAVAARPGLPRPVPRRLGAGRWACPAAGGRPHDPPGVAGIAGPAPGPGDPRRVRLGVRAGDRAGPVHAPPLRAGEDPARVRPRPRSQPGSLRAGDQPIPERPGALVALPVLGVPLPDRPDDRPVGPAAPNGVGPGRCGVRVRPGVPQDGHRRA